MSPKKISVASIKSASPSQRKPKAHPADVVPLSSSFDTAETSSVASDTPVRNDRSDQRDVSSNNTLSVWDGLESLQLQPFDNDDIIYEDQNEDDDIADLEAQKAEYLASRSLELEEFDGEEDDLSGPNFFRVNVDQAMAIFRNTSKLPHLEDDNITIIEEGRNGENPNKVLAKCYPDHFPDDEIPRNLTIETEAQAGAAAVVPKSKPKAPRPVPLTKKRYHNTQENRNQVPRSVRVPDADNRSTVSELPDSVMSGVERMNRHKHIQKPTKALSDQGTDDDNDTLPSPPPLKVKHHDPELTQRRNLHRFLICIVAFACLCIVGSITTLAYVFIHEKQQGQSIGGAENNIVDSSSDNIMKTPETPTSNNNRVDINDVTVTPSPPSDKECTNLIVASRRCFKWPDHNVVFYVTQTCSMSENDYIGILRSGDDLPAIKSPEAYRETVKMCPDGTTDCNGTVSTIVMDPRSLREGRFRAYLLRANLNENGDDQSDVQLGASEEFYIGDDCT